MATFAQRLKKLRKENGLTQKELAVKLGVGQSTIANYEQNIRFPDEEMLHRVADCFSISLDFLLGRTDVKTDLAAALDTESLSLEMLRELYEGSLREGNKREASELIMSAAACGVDIRDLYINVLETSLKEIGKDWEIGKIDVAEEHYFTAATIQIMSQLYHYLKPDAKRGTVFTGVTAPGEQHDIGMRMVADLLELDGWTTYNLGVDLPLTNMLSAVKLFKADLLGLSATMERNVSNLKFIIESVRNDPALADLKILVGGWPFVQDQKLWKSIGADGFSASAADAAGIAAQLVPPVLSLPGAVGEA